MPLIMQITALLCRRCQEPFDPLLVSDMDAQPKPNMRIGKNTLAHFAQFVQTGGNIVMRHRNFDGKLERGLGNHLFDFAL